MRARPIFEDLFEPGAHQLSRPNIAEGPRVVVVPERDGYKREWGNNASMTMSNARHVIFMVRGSREGA